MVTMMYELPGAAARKKKAQTGWFNNRHVFSHSPGGQKSEIRVSTGRVHPSDEALRQNQSQERLPGVPWLGATLL